jgi:OmpA-OmpF porin, OOP family
MTARGVVPVRVVVGRTRSAAIVAANFMLAFRQGLLVQGLLIHVLLVQVQLVEEAFRMYEPAKWWVGLIPLAALWIVGVVVKTGSVEDDIALRAKVVLAAASPESARALNLTVAGRDVRIEGPEFAAGQGERIGQTVDQADGVRLVDGRFRMVQAAKPYTFSVTRAGRQIVLAGTAPSPAARERLLLAANRAAADGMVVDNLTYATGAPEGFEAIAARGLTEAAKLEGGSFSLVDTTYSIAGTASSPAIFEAAIADPRRLPAPFKAGTVDIKEMAISPYVFKLEKSNGRVKLTGYAPDEAAHGDLVAAAKAAFFDDTVEDQLKIGKGAPANFASTLKSMFPALARLSSATLTSSDTTITVNGLAVYEKAADQIKAALAGAVPSGFTMADATIGVQMPGPALEVKACQPAFDGLLSKGRILFDTGSANLSKESLGLLDGLIEVAQRCHDADVEVAGFTDSVGSPDANLELSKRRAQAVVAYIGDSGIDVSRISSAGYGQAKPIASNDTPDGRAQNRRIEFLVK